MTSNTGATRFRGELQEGNNRGLRDPFGLDADLDVWQSDLSAAAAPLASQFVGLTATDSQHLRRFLDR